MKHLILLLIGVSFLLVPKVYAQYEVENIEPEYELLSNYEIASGKKSDSKYMFKLSSSSQRLTDPRLGFEYKVGKSFSIGGYVEGARFYSLIFPAIPLPIDSFILITSVTNYTIHGSIEGRYYMNQETSIEDGDGDNLNGLYVVAGLRSQWYNSLVNQTSYTPYMGIGIQSRILKYGLLDFNLLARYQDNKFSIYPEVRAGFAFSKGYELLELEKARCNILKCFDEKKYLVKLPMNGFLSMNYFPDINYIGLVLSPRAAFEHRIFKGVSMNHVLSASSIFNVNFNNNIASHVSQLFYSYENNIRYYFLKRKNIAKGKSADNLSGIYVASELKFATDLSARNLDLQLSKFSETFTYGANLGYQARLFKNFYFDVRGYLLRSKRNLFLVEPVIQPNFTWNDNYITRYGVNFEFGLMF